MKSIYTVLFIILFIIDSIKANINSFNNDNNIYTTSSSGDVGLTISIIVDQTSTISYNATECGAPSLPCKTFTDAGISARYLLYNNKDSLIPLNLVVELKNENYNLTSSGVFDNLYGFCDIQIKSYPDLTAITVDGTNYFSSPSSSSLSFLTLKPPVNYTLPKYSCGFLKIKFNNFIFQNIYLPSYSPIFLINEQLPNQLYTYIYFNIFNSKFININSPILKSQNQQNNSVTNNNNNSNNNNNNNNNLNPNNYNMVIIFSSCTFNGISSLYDGYLVSPAMIHVESGVLQVLLSTIQNIRLGQSSPQFIYLYNGNLKIFQSLFSNITSSSLSSFISTVESAYNTQLDTITFNNNKIGKWLEINQTTTLSINNYNDSNNNDNHNTPMDIVFLTDTEFSNNIFSSLYNNNNFIVINANNPNNNLVFNNLKFYNNILLDSDQVPSSSESLSSSSSSSSGKDISKFKLVSTSSFINLQGPNNYKLSSCEFRDDLNSIFLLYLNQTNLVMEDSILLSIDPVGGSKSNVSMDNLSFISESSNLYYCQECLFNGKPPKTPSLISTTTAILLILGTLVILGALGVLYVKFIHTKLSSNIKQRIKNRKQKRFNNFDSNLTSPLDSQTESLLSNYDNDDHFSINNNNHNSNSINSDSYNKFKVVGDLE